MNKANQTDIAASADQSSTQNPSEPVKALPAPKHHLSIKIIIVIILLILGGIVSAVAYQAFRPVHVTEMPVAEEPQSSLSPVPNDMSDWETYRNDEYEFELEYPSDWYPDSTGTQFTSFDPNGPGKPADGFNASDIKVQIVRESNNNNSLEDIVPDTSILDQQLNPIKIENTYNVEYPYFYGIRQIIVGTSDCVYVEAPIDWYYTICAFPRPSGEKEIIFNQILSTFRFLEEE